MRFPASDRLRLPCRFEQLLPGLQSADGRAVLPLIVLRPLLPGAPALGLTDRHHVVDAGLLGRSGTARLVFLLSVLRVQTPPLRQALEPEPAARGGVSSVPRAYGRVAEVLSWEVEHEHLPYQALYAELLLDLGGATVGVRTSASAASLAQAIGKARVEPGDWLSVERSRIDILGFEPES